MPTYSLNATSCPSPRVFAGPLISIADNSEAIPATIPQSTPLPQGNAAGTLEALNGDITRLDLGGGVYTCPLSILYGMDLTAGVGLLGNVAAGHVNINGIAEKASAGSVELNASATNRVWFKQDKTFYVAVDTTPPSVPAGHQCVYLGAFVTNGSSVTSVDLSGVVYCRHGVIERRVADAGIPGDTPSSSWRGWTQSAGGWYWWNGTAYLYLPTAAGSRIVDWETPSGSVNGSNQAFVLANVPSPATSVAPYLNGFRQDLGDDYTFSGSTVTFATAPATGDKVRVAYRY